MTCPKCGHAQPVPRTAYSGMCKKCGAHFRVAETLHPASKPAAPMFEQKRVTCFQCGTELDVPVTAASTLCKRCSSHVDLTDYQITQTVSKNFRTHGKLVVEEKGYVLNTEAVVGDGVIKGRLIGKTRGATHAGNLFHGPNYRDVHGGPAYRAGWESFSLAGTPEHRGRGDWRRACGKFAEPRGSSGLNPPRVSSGTFRRDI